MKKSIVLSPLALSFISRYRIFVYYAADWYHGKTTTSLSGSQLIRNHRLLRTCWTDNQAKLDLDVWRVLFFAEHVFLNVYGAQESIPRNEFRQSMYVAWRAGTITLFLLGS
jgi:hypothetical protein